MLEVDGSVDDETAPMPVAAKVNVSVAGTSAFGKSEGKAAALKRLSVRFKEITSENQQASLVKE